MLSIAKPPFEVAIVGKDYAPLLSEMQMKYQPDALYLGGASEGTLPLLENKLQDPETLIYVCQNKVCKMPTPEVEKAYEFLAH